MHSPAQQTVHEFSRSSRLWLNGMSMLPRRAVSPVSRLLALSCYLGVAPLWALFRVRRDDAYLRHHQAQGLAVLLLAVPLLLLALAGSLLLTDLLAGEPFLFDLELTWPAVRGYFVALSVAGAVWGLVCLAGMGLALAGSTRRPPLVRGDRSRLAQGLAMVWSCCVLAAVLLLAALAWHAQRLARTGGGPASAYLLFDPRGFEAFGTWGPKMLFYPVSREATARWGWGSVVVAPLARETFMSALGHGRLVVLLVHGDEGRIVSAGLEVGLPRGVPRSGRYLDLFDSRTGRTERVKAGPDLQLLYNSGCRTGTRGYAWAWQQRLAPTEVITFGRISGGLEHVLWIWAEAPARLRGIR